MLSPACSALALTLLFAPTALARTDDEIQARWKGGRHTLEEIAAECGAPAADAMRAWAEWAARQEYRFHLSDDGRVLLVSRASDRARALGLVERTCRMVDEILAEDAATAPPATTPGGAPAKPKPKPRAAAPLATAVVIEARDARDYATVLDHAVTLEPYLASWAESGKSLAGFTLVKPLCAAWIERLDGQEEWDPENELVHRLAHLLVVRRFGEQPHWLVTGIAWHVEQEIRGGIYCFPYRDQFVWASEHGSWKNELQRILGQSDRPFFDDLVAWKRGSYDADRAHQAWGLARFLAESHPGATARILADMRALREDKGVVRSGRTWQNIVGWEPSAEDQRAVFERHVGADFEAAMIASYVKGKKRAGGR